MDEESGPRCWFSVAATQKLHYYDYFFPELFPPAPPGRRLVRGSHAQLVICVPPCNATGLASLLLHCCFRETKAETNDPPQPAPCDCLFHEKAGLRFPFSSPAVVTRYSARIFAPRPAPSCRRGSGLEFNLL